MLLSMVVNIKVVDYSLILSILCALVGYFLGNIQTAIIVSKLYYHDDVRNHGSGNAGSTNMVRVFGLRPGIVTFLGDFAKAALGVIIGWLFMGRHGGYIAGLFVIVGHCWPVLAKFRGGKGVASSCGFAMLTCPIAGLICIAVGAIVFAISKKVSLMSLSGMALFPVLVMIFGWFVSGDWELFIVSLILAGIIFLRHRENIKRLVNGTEPKLIPKDNSRVH